MARVGIVIVNYNGEKYQNDCIKSLYEMVLQDFEIIVVDSASTDHSIKNLKQAYPLVHILKQKENVGVAEGNNIGIAYSRKLGTEYTLLLNNDVIVDKYLLSNIVEKANAKVVTVPKIYYYKPNNMLWFAGGELTWKKGTAEHIGIYEIDKGQYNVEKYITYAPTCCMLIHNTVFDMVGKIDKNVFMYFDDTDYCVRMQEKGIRILYVPSAKMWHKVSSSSGGEKSKIAVYYINRNQLYYIKKYKKNVRIITKFYIYTKAFLKYIVSPIYCKNNKYIATAYYDYITGKMGRKDFDK